jgi:hypothetical protein
MLLTYTLMSEQYIRKLAEMLNIDDIDNKSTNELKSLIVEKHDSMTKQADGGSFATALRRAYKGKFDKKPKKKAKRKTTKKAKKKAPVKRKPRKVIKKKAVKTKKIKPRGRKIVTPYIKKADEGVIRNIVKQELKVTGISPVVERSQHLELLKQLSKLKSAPTTFEAFKSYLSRNISKYQFSDPGLSFEQKLSTLWLLYKPLLPQLSQKKGLTIAEQSFLNKATKMLYDKSQKLTANQKKAKGRLKIKLSKGDVNEQALSTDELIIIKNLKDEIKKAQGSLAPSPIVKKKKLTGPQKRVISDVSKGNILTKKSDYNILVGLMSKIGDYIISDKDTKLVQKGIADYDTQKALPPPKKPLTKGQLDILNKIKSGKQINKTEYNLLVKLLPKIEDNKIDVSNDDHILIANAIDNYVEPAQQVKPPKPLKKKLLKGPNKDERTMLSKINKGTNLTKREMAVVLPTLKKKFADNKVDLTDKQKEILAKSPPSKFKKPKPVKKEEPEVKKKELTNNDKYIIELIKDNIPFNNEWAKVLPKTKARIKSGLYNFTKEDASLVKNFILKPEDIEEDEEEEEEEEEIKKKKKDKIKASLGQLKEISEKDYDKLTEANKKRLDSTIKIISDTFPEISTEKIIVGSPLLGSRK